MNNYPEDPSLLEVREWKEQCCQEESQLTQAEYLENLQQIAQTVEAQYHLNLPKPNEKENFKNINPVGVKCE